MTMTTMAIIMAAGLITVCGTIAYLAIKSSAPSTHFARMLAQIAENEKTPEGRERNRRFSEFLYMNGIG